MNFFFFADPIPVKYEPVGRWYEVLCKRRKERKTLSHHSYHSESSSEEEEGDLSEDEEDEQVLRTLDPKDWKVTYNSAHIITLIDLSFASVSNDPEA